MIRTVNLVKHYENGAIRALDGVSIEIPKGEYLSIMGPSGSGKSTFLNLVGALDHPTSGEVWLNGTELSKQANLDSLRAREVGFIFQLHNLIPTLTSVENVEIPMMPLGTGRRERRKRASGLLELVGLGHRLHSISTKLSGGERQRVSIARALANSPSLILADEPTGDVDTKTGGQIMQTLLDVRKKTGATLIVVTHDPEIAKGAERLIRLKDGRIEEQ